MKVITAEPKKIAEPITPTIKPRCRGGKLPRFTGTQTRHRVNEAKPAMRRSQQMINQQTETGTKWLSFRRRHFKMRRPEKNAV